MNPDPDARYEVRWARTGMLIEMHSFSTRLKHADVSWVIDAIGSTVDWPNRYLVFYINQRTFRYIHSIAYKDRTSLLDLHAEGLRQGLLENGSSKLVISIEKEDPPEMFWAGECICMFPGHGCCVTGRTDALGEHCAQSLQWGEEFHYGCWWCGNGGCCRSGNCGEGCCEAASIQLSPMTPWVSARTDHSSGRVGGFMRWPSGSYEDDEVSVWEVDEDEDGGVWSRPPPRWPSGSYEDDEVSVWEVDEDEDGGMWSRPPPHSVTPPPSSAWPLPAPAGSALPPLTLPKWSRPPPPPPPLPTWPTPPQLADGRGDDDEVREVDDDDIEYAAALPKRSRPHPPPPPLPKWPSPPPSSAWPLPAPAGSAEPLPPPPPMNLARKRRFEWRECELWWNAGFCEEPGNDEFFEELWMTNPDAIRRILGTGMTLTPGIR